MPLPMVQESTSIRMRIAIAAGKGGVGKSSVTVQLAFALRDLGLKVGILDGDLYGPSIRQMLPEGKLPSQDGKRIFPAEMGGIQVISLAFLEKRMRQQRCALRLPMG